MILWKKNRLRRAGPARLYSSPGRRAIIEKLEQRLVLSVNITAFHNDDIMPGVNALEVHLSPANVQAGSFGRLFTTSLDGAVYAEPLVATGITIASGPFTTAGATGVHDIVLVATEHDSLYAIDASASGGAILWHRSFLDQTIATNNTLGATAITTVLDADVTSSDIAPEMGITGTPVIDLTTNTAYLVATTKETIGGVIHFVQRLHAISLSDGTDRTSPFLIGDTINDATNNTPIYVYGAGDGAVTDPYNGTGKQVVQFNALRENQRAGLSLVNGEVYVAWASHSDQSPYHGWVVAWNVSNLTTKGMVVVGVFNVSPNGGLAGVWQGGGPLAFEPDGSAFYLETGNGRVAAAPETYNPQGFPTDGDYYESLVKVEADPTTSPTNQNINGWGFKAVDFFTPFNQPALDNADRDFGSGAPLILPASAGIPGHPDLMVAEGKEGKVYVVDRDNLGKFNAINDNVVNAVPNGLGNNTPAIVSNGFLNAGVYFNGYLYQSSGYSGPAYQFAFNSAGILTQVSETSANMGYLPGSVTVSADGTTDGILWSVDRNSNVLRAYSTTTLSTEIWDSGINPNDALGATIKFATPTVANGEVYVGTSDSIVVYGLTPPQNGAPIAPVVAPVALSGTSINVTWTDSTVSPNLANGYSIEESSDGVNFSAITTAPAGATSIAIGGFNAQTTYYFRVRGYNSIGYSGYSNVASVFTSSTAQQAPGTPSALNGMPASATSVNLLWTDSTTNQTGFYLDRATDSGFTQNLITQTLPASPTSITDTDTGLAPGETFYYRIRAFNSAGSSANSNTTSVFIPLAPAKPSNALVTNVTTNEIDLSWTDNAGTTATDYLILRSVGTGDFTSYTMLPAEDDAPPVAYPWNDTGLTPGTAYQYHIEAVNVAGHNDFTGANAVTLTTPPTGLSATVAAGAISLAWTAPFGAVEFNVYRGTAPGAEGSTPIATVFGTTFIDTSAKSLTTYYYTVTALNANISHVPAIPAESAVSTESVSGRIPEAPAPGVPAKLTAVIPAPNNGVPLVTLSWTASNGATSYTIYRSSTSGGEGGTPLATNVVGTTYTDSSAAFGVAYYYKIAAANASASSGMSSEVSATPIFQAHINFTAQVGGLPVANYVNDVGLPYGSQGNGLTFGWNQINVLDGADRFASNAPNEMQDSFSYMESNYDPNAWWAIAVPNGSYQVRVTVGDPLTYASVDAIDVNGTLNATTDIVSGGTLAVSGTPTATNLWFSNTVTVNVTTGILYVSSAPGSVNNLIDGVDIVQVGNPPAAPTQLTASSNSSSTGTASVGLSWAASAGAATYSVYRSTTMNGEGGTPLVSNLTGTTYTDGAAAFGTTYYYKVVAVNPSGTSAFSNEAAIEPLFQAHINFTSQNQNRAAAGYLNDVGLAYGSQANGLTFGWNQNSVANGADRLASNAPNEMEDSFNYMQAGNNPNAWWAIAVPNGTYQVRVTVGDPLRFSSVYGIDVNGTLSSTTHKVTGGTLTVSGTPTASNLWFSNLVTVTVTNGILYVSSAPGTSNNKIDGIDIVQAGLVPAAPAQLTASSSATNTTAAQVSLSWSGSAGAASYSIYRSTTSGGEGGTPLASGITGTSFVDNTAVFSTTYFYKVSAINAFGTSALSSEVSQAAKFQAHINFTSQSDGVAAPGYLNDVGLAYGPQANGLTFGWNQNSTTNGADQHASNAPNEMQDSFNYMQAGNNPNAWWAIAVPNGTYQVTVTEGDPESFASVYGIDVDGTLNTSTNLVTGGILALSGTPTASKLWFSGTVTVTVTSGILYVSSAPGSADNKMDGIDIVQTVQGPAIPTALTATLTSGVGQPLLSWTAAAGAVSYNIYRATTSNGEGGTPLATDVVGTTFTDTTAAVGTTYYYKIAGVNSTGISPFSSEVSTTPPFQAHINFTAQSGGLSAAGYVNDVGLAYGLQPSGLTYGWNQNTTADGADRYAKNAPNEMQDSFIYMNAGNNPNAWWAIAVPNGTYQVTVTVGDPSSFASIYGIDVNGTLNTSTGIVSGGTLAVSGTPTASNLWFVGTVTVNITGGILYVSSAPGTMTNEIDGIDIVQTTTVAAVKAAVVVAPAVTATTATAAVVSAPAVAAASSTLFSSTAVTPSTTNKLLKSSGSVI